MRKERAVQKKRIVVKYKLVKVFSVQELYNRYPDREFLMPLDLTREVMSAMQARHEQNKEKAKAYQEPIPEKKPPSKKKQGDPKQTKENRLKKRRLSNQAYRQANRENIREKARARRNLHKDEENAKCRDYYQKNKEKITDRHKVYNLANKEKRALYDKSYREINKEKIKAQRKTHSEAKKQSP